MAYTVLARRYRSQTFDEVVGQDAVAQTLKNAINSNRVAHAYLFCGTRGVGKTTVARVLAKSLNCLDADGPTTTPCCKCDSCISINLGEDIDVIEIDGASNTGVDNIRQLRQNAIYRPARARSKIYIIDEVHMLSTGAFNALLKILEEPPEHVKFIFATTEPNKVLATIQSRCQRFDFTSIGPDIICKQLKMILKEEKIKFTDDLLLHLARLANGSMRDALSLLDQLISTGTSPLTVELLEEALGQPDRQKLCNLIEMISSDDAAGVLVKIDELLKSGQTATQIVDSMIDYMRDLMVIRSTSGKSDILILTEDERKQMTALSAGFDIAALVYNITTLEKLRWTIKNSDAPRALLEASMLRLALSEHFLGIESIMSRLSSGAQQSKRPWSKKKVATEKTPTEIPAASQPVPEAVPDKQTIEPVADAAKLDLQGIKDNWQSALAAITANDPKASGYLKFLKLAIPAEWDKNILTLGFPKSSAFGKDICEKRIDEIASDISAALGVNVKIKLTIGDFAPAQKDFKSAGAKLTSQQRQDALDDPAVKTLISGLNATVVQIDETKEAD